MQPDLTETAFTEVTSNRHFVGGGNQLMRENLILNRKNLTKPLTAKATNYGQKRAQSGNPGAARNLNRLI